MLADQLREVLSLFGVHLDNGSGLDWLAAVTGVGSAQHDKFQSVILRLELLCSAAYIKFFFWWVFFGFVVVDAFY